MLYSKEFKNLTTEEVEDIKKTMEVKLVTISDIENHYNKNIQEGGTTDNLVCG